MRSGPFFFASFAVAATLATGCGPSGPADGIQREVVSAAYDGDTYVFVGERWNTNEVAASRPILLTSPDARELTVRDEDLPAIPLNAVAQGNGVFFAVGGQIYQEGGSSDFLLSSTALFSADGVSWTESEGIPDQPLRAVAFGNGTFVAVAQDGSTYHTEDGKVLTPGPKLSGLAFVSGVAFGADRFVVYGDAPSVFVSTDGSSFSTIAMPTDLAGIDFAGGAFHGAGVVGADETGGEVKELSSQDGVTWSASATSTGVFNIAEKGGTYLGVNDTEVWRSSNASSWSAVDTYDTYHYRYDVIAAGGQFVLVGRNEITVSEDGETFESTPVP